MGQSKKYLVIAMVVIIIVIIAIVITLSLYRSSSKKELFLAIRNGDCDTITEIVNNHPFIINENRVSNSFFAVFTDQSSNTPLLEACSVGDMDVIKLLVENGADVNKSSNVVSSYPLIKILTTGYSNKYDIAWYFIENGADLSVDEKFYTVPYAIVSCPVADDDIDEQESALKLMTYAIEKGVSLESPQKKFYNIDCLLGYAARSNYMSVCEYLLDNDIFNVNEIVDNKGSTSLMVATQGRAYGTCELLLEYGADKEIRDSDGKTAYDYAVEMNDIKLMDILKSNTGDSVSATDNTEGGSVY